MFYLKVPRQRKNVRILSQAEKVWREHQRDQQDRALIIILRPHQVQEILHPLNVEEHNLSFLIFIKFL